MQGMEMSHNGGVGPQVVGASDPDNFPRRRRRDLDEQPPPDDGKLQVPMTDRELKWGFGVLVASTVDMGASFVILVTALVHAYRDNGVSLYCLGFQSLAHLMSSITLAARFIDEWCLGAEPSQGLLRKARRRGLLREQILSITMGMALLISSAALLFKAFRKLRFWSMWYKDHEEMDADVKMTTELLAWWGWGMYTLQAAFRFVAAKILARSILWHAFATSVVSLLFLFVMAIATSVQKEWTWKAEPVAAIALAVISLVEGVRVLYWHLEDIDCRLQIDQRA
eukprot:NODE_12167_length_1241_cov_9.475763.p1 GENE.NODE_12167_length_1241_cov_9.475763~~NODE_12167_length_1241_cov_9.475763.p1  ORF type:complete len:282 (-),score=76.73 NODE_12167_length_1241_cov_9.475763:268-1113(-)